MKRVFKVINIVAVLFTICLVSFDFISNFSSGNKIYKDVYNYSNCTQMRILLNDLSKANALTISKASNILSNEQQEYLPTIIDSIEKTNGYLTFFSLHLSEDNSKSNKINKISEKLEDLEKARNNLVLDLEEYLIKFSGNVTGSASTSIDYLLAESVNLLSNYADTAISINNIIDYANTDNTEQNLIELHLTAMTRLKSDYENIGFKTDIISTVQDLNERLFLIDNNFVLQESLFSTDATLFNQYYEKCDLDRFFKNYASYTNLSIDLKTEKDNCVKTYYYFDIITEGK